MNLLGLHFIYLSDDSLMIPDALQYIDHYYYYYRPDNTKFICAYKTNDFFKNYNATVSNIPTEILVTDIHRNIMDRRGYLQHLMSSVKILYKSTSVVLDMNGRLSGDIPVSYTHLDVYKRQVSDCMAFLLGD